ncbi:MAG: N-acetylmuramidase domain-containing protein [Anaerolineae bacterium]
MAFKSQPLALQVDSPEVGYLNVRSQPSTSGALVTKVSHGDTVTPLEPEGTVRAKVGQKGEWLHVRLDDNREVYAAAWYLKLSQQLTQSPTTEHPTLQVQINSPELGYLNVRSQPGGTLVTTAPHDSVITPLEPEETVRAKVGQQGEWLHVRLDDDKEGYVAAWYLKLHETEAETDAGTSHLQQPTLQIWIYSPEVGYLNIRKAPSTASARITQAPHDASLLALEAETDVLAKIGQYGQWLHVRLTDGADCANPTEGYAAAPYLSLTSARPPDTLLEPPEEQRITVTSNLIGTARQVAQTWNRLGGLLQTLADQLAIDPGVAVAILTVESGGRPFGPDGRMIVRFENHIFYDWWGKHKPDAFAQHFTFNPNQRWKDHQWRSAPGQLWRDFHGDQKNEWEVLEFACTLDDTAARLSISMGGPQIMGFNYAAVGYTSVQQMFDAFVASERNQVAGFFNFVRSRGEKTVQMLQSSDFEGFATIYNGHGQATAYGNLIRQTYEAYRRLRTVSFSVPSGVSTGMATAPFIEVDDLRRILGIGPKTAARLQAEGIHSFVQLAALDVEQLRGLLGDAASYARRLKTWAAQARLAAWGDWDALGTFQAQLKS